MLLAINQLLGHKSGQTFNVAKTKYMMVRLLDLKVGIEKRMQMKCFIFSNMFELAYPMDRFGSPALKEFLSYPILEVKPCTLSHLYVSMWKFFIQYDFCLLGRHHLSDAVIKHVPLHIVAFQNRKN